MFRTWAITFRPIGGVTDDDLKRLDQWGARHKHFLLGVEKEGESRHAHMAFLTEKATSPSNLKTTILHVLKSGTDAAEKRLAPAEIRNFRMNCVKPWYDHNWVENYIGADRDHKSGDKYVCYRNTLPDDLDDLNPYYPSKDDKSLCKPVGVKYLRWEKLLLADVGLNYSWKESDFEQWLLKRMCHDRDIEPIPDVRKRRQEAAMLRLFVHHHGHPVDPQLALDFAKKFTL